MGLYDFLITAFHQFVRIFPESLQWVAALLILIGLIGLLATLVRQHILFILVVILLLPFLIPVAGEVIADIFAFIRYLVDFIRHIFFGVIIAT
ncbi:MAG TPA: hypothetical protein VF272_03140 [Candidatus Saccharimonadia bacterium]